MSGFGLFGDVNADRDLRLRMIGRRRRVVVDRRRRMIIDRRRRRRPVIGLRLGMIGMVFDDASRQR
jgi:hypothetical protein